MDVEELLQKYGSKVDRLYDTVASVDVFDRQFGAELTAWELQLQNQFHDRVSSTRSRFRGFVKYTDDPSLVLISPSPWMLEGQFVYFDTSVPVPPDGSYIEIIGSNILVPLLLERRQINVRAIHAEEFDTIPHDITSMVSRPPSFRTLSRMLFENVGMAEASKRVFSQLYVSSPPTLGTIGGLTAGIQAIASQKQVKRLVRFMKDVLPPSMHTPKKTRNVRGVRVDTPGLWRMETGSIGKSQMQTLCLNRRDPSGYREVSLAALTEESTATLPDVPLALATEDFWIETRSATELRLPVIKAAITYQLLTPKVSQRSITSAQKHIQERLEVLRSSYGLADESITRGMILDANDMGRPLSAIKLARASARAYWKEKVTAKDLKKAWDKALEPALKEFIEITEVKDKSEKRWGEETRLDRYNTKVVRALQRLDTGKKGSFGPTIDEIIEESGIKKHEVTLALDKMKNDGLVYEPKRGHFRLV